MKVGLYYADDAKLNGPSKGVSNLIRGLDMIGVQVEPNKTLDMNGCMQGWIAQDILSLPESTLMGPNLVNMPGENPGMWHRYHSYVFRSIYLANHYAQYVGTKNRNLNVWYGGIDTDRFKPEGERSLDCLVYFKRRPEKDLEIACAVLKDKGLSYEVLSYGSYTEEDFIRLSRKAKFCLMVNAGEGFGHASFEMWSMNLPTYILHFNEFHGPTAPVFSPKCGIVCDDFSRFDEFLGKVGSFTPREFVLDGFTLKEGAQRYFSHLVQAHWGFI